MWSWVFLLSLVWIPSGNGQLPTNEHLIVATAAPVEANVDTLQYVQIVSHFYTLFLIFSIFKGLATW